MPTAIPSGEKTNFINIVKAYNPLDINYVGWLSTNLNNFSDIVPALFYDTTTMQDAISWNVPFITSLMAVFSSNDSDLIAAGIYVSKSEGFTNPVLLVNCNDTGGGISITSNQTSLGIIGTTTIKGNITISSSASLSYLYAGANSIIGILDSSASNSNINQLWVRAINGFTGSVAGAITSSSIGNVIVDSGAFYGGVLNDNPDATCANPVTGLTATNIPANLPTTTHNNITITWTAPTNPYISLIIQYRKSSNTDWLTADNTVGNFISVNTFIFTKFEHDTFYDFQVIVVCPNGGYSTPDTIYAVQTNQTLP